MTNSLLKDVQVGYASGKTVAGTGHRPDKFGGYSDEVEKNLFDLAVATLSYLSPERVISGMALGWDMALAAAAAHLGIPFEAAIPFAGQEGRWPISSQERYQELMKRAAKVTVVCEGGYAAWKMQRRNEYMVKNCQLLVAAWDGSTGGTGNCVAYALKIGCETVNVLDADWHAPG